MKIIDVIKWDGAPNVFAYKFPDSELNTKSQLIVSESQEAIFVHEGKYYGPFGAGRHTLNTKNLPFLTSLATSFFTGGLSPFTAEVWFIQKAIPLNILWGTTDPILVEDPIYHIILPVRSFGQYGVKISNAMKFLGKMAGRLPAFTEITLSSYLKGVIVTQVKTHIGQILTDKQVCILQVAGKLADISAELQSRISEELDAYGMEIVSFQVNSISSDSNDPSVQKLKAALAKKAEMNILGFTYQQERSFDTLETAAGNQGAAGSVMNAGIGLGMGLGLASPMGNMVGNLAQNIDIRSQGKCSRCGSAIQQNTAFCPNCGNDCRQEQDIAPRQCPQCGNTLSAGTKFCPNCGTPSPTVCPQCGKTVAAASKFCPDCGKKMN